MAKWRITVGPYGASVESVVVDETDLFQTVQGFMAKYAKELKKRRGDFVIILLLCEK
jgi:Ribonuclease G/E